MKLEKSLYFTICGHDCDPNMSLKIPIIDVWPVQLDAQAVATYWTGKDFATASLCVKKEIDD